MSGMKFISALLASVFLALPLAASADIVVVPPPVNTIIPGQPLPSAGPTASELAAEIQALKQQIAQMQGQSGNSTGTSASACGAISGPLGPGSSGAAVSALQQFLASDPSVYPQGLVTGYYGSLTVAAVQAFQTKSGIVSSGSSSTTGYGRVGPQTLAAIGSECGGASTGAGVPTGVVGGFINVSPVSGAAPLPVEVEATVNTTSNCGAATYTLDFGDGSPSQQISVPAGSCQSVQQTYTHTYTVSGTRAVTLSIGSHSSSATIVVQ